MIVNKSETNTMDVRARLLDELLSNYCLAGTFERVAVGVYKAVKPPPQCDLDLYLDTIQKLTLYSTGEKPLTEIIRTGNGLGVLWRILC